MKIKFKFIDFILFLLIALGGFLRFYYLDRAPLGLYVDEAAIGYNGYSILSTGKDEYGKSFPLFFRSFGSYIMPLYVYFSVIPIWMFGLSIFSVRFVSAVFGTLAIPLVYLLAKRLLADYPKQLWLLASFIYALSPWSIFVSRAAYETNLALFLLLLAIYCQLHFVHKPKSVFLFSAAFFYALSSYTYLCEKFISPVIFVGILALQYQGQLKKSFYKNIILSLLFFLLLFIPQIALFQSQSGQQRIKGLTLSQDNALKVFARYSAYFSPRNLFFEPDSDRQRSFPGLSVFYSWMIIPYFVGLYLFFKSPLSFEKKVILFILLISPIPASLAGDPFSTIRALPLLFPLVLIISLGIFQLALYFKNNLLRYSMYISFVIISLLTLFRSCFVLLPRQRFSDWQYGYHQLVEQLELGNYEKVLVDDNLGVSYVELLFFQKYSPREFQRKWQDIDMANYYNIGEWKKQVSWQNIEVRGIIWEKDIYEDKLIVATPIGISDGQAKEHFLSKVFVIIGPDGKEIFNGYLTNPELKRLNDERKLKLKNESGNN